MAIKAKDMSHQLNVYDVNLIFSNVVNLMRARGMSVDVEHWLTLNCAAIEYRMSSLKVSFWS